MTSEQDFEILTVTYIAITDLNSDDLSLAKSN